MKKGCSVEGSQVLCTVCPFKDDVIGCQEYRRMYGADEVWSGGCSYTVGVVLFTLLSILAIDFMFPDIGLIGFICCVEQRGCTPAAPPTTEPIYLVIGLVVAITMFTFVISLIITNPEK